MVVAEARLTTKKEQRPLRMAAFAFSYIYLNTFNIISNDADNPSFFANFASENLQKMIWHIQEDLVRQMTFGERS